jgi:hypothetical protein
LAADDRALDRVAAGLTIGPLVINDGEDGSFGSVNSNRGFFDIDGNDSLDILNGNCNNGSSFD